MTAAEMIVLMNRTPFEPLEIHLNDGTTIRVEHPYEIATQPKGNSCVIYDENGLMRIVAYRNITEVITTAAAN